MRREFLIKNCGTCPMLQEHEAWDYGDGGVSCSLGFELETEIIRGPVAKLNVISRHCGLHKEKINIELSIL